MKTNILSKITLICLLFISFSCSKENTGQIEEVTIESKVNYTISYKESSKSNQANRRGEVNWKYLKIVFASGADRDLFNTIFWSQSNQTLFHIPIEVNSDTFVYIYDGADQAAIDSLFSSAGGLCLLCNYVIETEYIVVAEVCYDAFTTESNKQETRDDFPELMHVIVNGGDCETWVMHFCCLSQEECPVGAVTPYVSSVNEIQ